MVPFCALDLRTLDLMLKAESSCCCCHQLPYIFVRHLNVFRPGAAKEKLTFVSCQFALVLLILVTSNALCACCCCVLWHLCCCILAYVSLLVLCFPSLSSCSIHVIRLRRGRPGLMWYSGTSGENSVLVLSGFLASSWASEDARNRLVCWAHGRGLFTTSSWF